MKRNRIHIQESGSPAKKNDVIVVTSTPNEDDLVTAQRNIHNNMDFGSGYKYKLMVMDASIAP